MEAHKVHFTRKGSLPVCSSHGRFSTARYVLSRNPCEVTCAKCSRYLTRTDVAPAGDFSATLFSKLFGT